MHKRYSWFAFAALFALAPLPALSSPPMPAHAAQSVIPMSFGKLPAYPPAHWVIPPTTAAELDALPAMSNVLYQHFARGIGHVPRAAQPGPQVGVKAVPQDPTAINTFNLVYDSNEDVEPTIVRSGGNTLIAATKYVSVNGQTQPRNYYYTLLSNNISEYSGPLSVPTDIDYSGDPMLYPSNGSGPYGSRVYASALIGNTSVTGVGLWHSDDNGLTWSGCQTVTSVTAPTTIDKPSVAVSWHAGTVDYVYVAYVLWSSGSDHVMITRSTDGGANWDTPVEVGASSNLTDPIVMVAANGYVYVAWPDYAVTPQRIRLARSPDVGTIAGTWAVDTNGPSGNFVFGGTTASPTQLNGHLRAFTVPMARYNWITNRVQIVWHDWEPSGSRTDVRFASKGTNGWSSVQTLNNENLSCSPYTTDQFMPALDFDPNGYAVVTFYDRQVNCGDTWYDLHFVQLDANENIVQSSTLVNAGFDSDPACDPDPYYAYNFIGDYQGVWFDESTSMYYSA